VVLRSTICFHGKNHKVYGASTALTASALPVKWAMMCWYENIALRMIIGKNPRKPVAAKQVREQYDFKDFENDDDDDDVREDYAFMNDLDDEFDALGVEGVEGVVGEGPLPLPPPAGLLNATTKRTAVAAKQSAVNAQDALDDLGFSDPGPGVGAQDALDDMGFSDHGSDRGSDSDSDLGWLTQGT
jgi:hypothetical protein